MPKYLSIANQIEQQILSQTMPAGTQLPTEKELMEQFNVSRQTVRNAFSCLMKKDLIYAVKGSGTFVSDRVSPAPTSKNIAVLITNANSYIFPFKSASMNGVFSKHGYISNIFATNNRIDYEENIIREIMNTHYAGVIIEVTRAVIPRVGRLVSDLAEKLPLILIDGYYPSCPQIPYVSLDDQKGGYKATQYLIEHGHRKIFHVGKVDDIQGLFRYYGYLQALSDYQLEFNEDHVFWLPESLYTNTPEPLLDLLCDQIRQCTAVFFYNDYIAVKIIPVLQKRGVRIPEDLSVMSYDNSLEAMLPFQLSCIAYPLKDLGRVAAENLLKRIEDPNCDATYIFEPELVERSSVRRIGPAPHPCGKIEKDSGLPKIRTLAVHTEYRV